MKICRHLCEKRILVGRIVFYEISVKRSGSIPTYYESSERFNLLFSGHVSVFAFLSL